MTGTRTTDERTRAIALVAAELGLAALAFGTVATFTRLFIGWEFLATLAVPVLGSWGVAVALRRLRVPVGPSIAASLAIGVVVLAWRFAPTTTWFGVPTPATATAFADQVRTAFGGFADQIAPVPARDGFLIGIAAVMWLFGCFADLSAMRYSAPVQAVIPYAAAVAASGILARGTGRIAAGLAFVAGLAVFAVTQRAWQSTGERWIRGDVRRGVRSVALGATIFAALAVLVGVVVGPLVPGDDQALVDLRRLGRSDAPRTVVSPFVGVTSLLGERSDQVVFTVRAAAPSYWRLTALEAYDAQRSIWTSRGTYRDADGRLGDAPDAPGATLDQEFRIDGLGGLWLPAAFAPAAVESRLDIGYDAGSSSLIARKDAMAPGTTYRVQSALQVVGAAELEQAPTGDRGDVDPDTFASSGLSDEVRTTARRIVDDAGATTPYAEARAIQDWFRNEFTYDTSVDYRGEPDAVSAFLRDRRGFCQQFASTFALMARSLGIPARVAVGFTPGDQLADGTFVVRGRHAHAWPEVDLGPAGWVAFEPTPGRGNPQATGYTGIEAAQAPPPPEQAASTTSTSAPTTTSVPVTGADAPNDVDASATATTAPPVGSDDRSSGATSWWPLTVALVAIAALGAALPLVRRRLRRRRHRADPTIGSIGVAWDDTVDRFRALGVIPSAAETPLEYATRVARLLDDPEVDDPLDDMRFDDPSAVATDVRALAGLETRRRFGAGPIDTTDLELADQLGRRISAATSAALGPRDRVLLRLR